MNIYINYNLYNLDFTTKIDKVWYIVIPFLPVVFVNVVLFLNFCNWQINYFKIGHMAAISDERAIKQDLGNIIKIDRQIKIIKIVCLITFIIFTIPGIYLSILVE